MKGILSTLSLEIAEQTILSKISDPEGRTFLALVFSLMRDPKAAKEYDFIIARKQPTNVAASPSKNGRAVSSGRKKQP
jgi:hypothetical protein